MVESSVLMTSHKESRLFPCGPSDHTTLSQWLLLHQSRDESQEYGWRPKLVYIYSYLLLINCQMKFILAHMSALEYGRVRRSSVWVLFNPSSALQWRSPFYTCSRPFVYWGISSALRSRRQQFLLCCNFGTEGHILCHPLTLGMKP